ncbi:MAG: hypothetical protein ACRCYU_05860 [Nocardioides sp.]
MDPGNITLLLSGGIGVVGTLVGAALTQWRSDVRLSREADKEREARLFDYRRDAYLAVIEKYQQIRDGVSEYENGLRPDWSPPHTDEEALVPFYRTLNSVDFHGTPETVRVARDLYDATARWFFGHGHGPGEPHKRDQAAEQAYWTFLRAVRTEFGMSDLPDVQNRPWWGDSDESMEPGD